MKLIDFLYLGAGIIILLGAFTSFGSQMFRNPNMPSQMISEFSGSELYDSEYKNGSVYAHNQFAVMQNGTDSNYNLISISEPDKSNAFSSITTFGKTAVQNSLTTANNINKDNGSDSTITMLITVLGGLVVILFTWSLINWIFPGRE
jgi:hypothetical protein